VSFYVYILYSTSADTYYIGQTENIDDRLFRHKNSGSQYTKFASDWEVVYKACFDNRNDAVKHESAIKKKKAESI
jgi:putative endonuclease